MNDLRSTATADAPDATTEATRADDPRWIRGALHLALEDVRAYLATFAAIALRPARFGRAWIQGDGNAMGPLAFMSASAGVSGLLLGALETAYHLPGAGDSIWKKVGEVLAPYAYYAAVGLACHLALAGVTRVRRWSSSLAASLYAGAALPTLSLVLATLGVMLLLRVGGAHVEGQHVDSDSHLLVTLALVPMLWFYVSLARLLSGIHAVRGWIAAAVVSVAALGTAFAPTSLPLPVWHFHLGFERAGGDWSIAFDVRNS